MWQNGSWGVLCSLRVSSARSNDPIHGMKCKPQNTYDMISYASMYVEQSRLASIFAKNPQRRSQNPGTRFRRSTKFCETKSTCYAQTVRVDPKKLIYFFVIPTCRKRKPEQRHRKSIPRASPVPPVDQSDVPHGRDERELQGTAPQKPRRLLERASPRGRRATRGCRFRERRQLRRRLSRLRVRLRVLPPRLAVPFPAAEHALRERLHAIRGVLLPARAGVRGAVGRALRRG